MVGETCKKLLRNKNELEAQIEKHHLSPEESSTTDIAWQYTNDMICDNWLSAWLH